MKNFTFGGAKFFLGSQRRQSGPISKKSKNPYTERWSQPTAKISAFQLNLKVFKKSGSFGGVLGPPQRMGVQYQKFEKNPHTEWWSEPKAKIAAPQLNQKVFKTNTIGKNVHICNPSFVTRERELTVLNSSSL